MNWPCEGGVDALRQPLGPAVMVAACELDELLGRGDFEFAGGGPALQQPEHSGAPEILAGDVKRGRESADQVDAQPVEQAALIPAARSSSRARERSSPARSP